LSDLPIGAWGAFSFQQVLPRSAPRHTFSSTESRLLASGRATLDSPSAIADCPFSLWTSAYVRFIISP